MLRLVKLEEANRLAAQLGSIYAALDHMDGALIVMKVDMTLNDGPQTVFIQVPEEDARSFLKNQAAKTRHDLVMIGVDPGERSIARSIPKEPEGVPKVDWQMREVNGQLVKINPTTGEVLEEPDCRPPPVPEAVRSLEDEIPF